MVGLANARPTLREGEVTPPELHEIRSPATGVIEAIQKHPGVAVRCGETVLTIRLPDAE